MAAVVFASSRPRFHQECVWRDVGYSGGLTFILDVCMLARVSCQKSPVLTGVVSSGSTECCQCRGREQKQRTTPLEERRADRGSDSAFQMADIARRILARGSTSTPVCETADFFLFLSLSPSRPPTTSFSAPAFSLPSNSKR